MKRLKRLQSIILIFTLIFTLISTSVYATTSEELNVKITTDKIISQNAQIFAAEMSKYKEEFMEEFGFSLDKLDKLNNESIKFTSEDLIKSNEMRSIYIMIANKKIDQNMEANGYVKVDSEAQDASIATAPSDLVLTDSLYYNEHGKNYIFTGSWNFLKVDAYRSTYDIAAVRMLEPYRIVGTYAWSYDNLGVQTGYDDNGTHTSGSHVTKRFEDKHGVAYNVDDQAGWAGGGRVLFNKAASGQVQMAITGSGYNKIFLDYEHNFKTSELQVNAILDVVQLEKSKLTVSYAQSSERYPRTSGGREISQ